jgi:hypothetical protein
MGQAERNTKQNTIWKDLLYFHLHTRQIGGVRWTKHSQSAVQFLVQTCTLVIKNKIVERFLVSLKKLCVLHSHLNKFNSANRK